MVGDVYTHPTAEVEPDVTLGEGARIWHHCHVRGGSSIGADTQLGKNVYVDAGVDIGDRVKIQNNVSVYLGVTIEDEVFVGPSAVFTNDLFPRAVNDGWTVTPTLVRKGASIGANATIKCGATLGSYSMVGAGSVVTRDVDDHQLVVGNPARPMGWVCECGAVVSRDPMKKPSSFECEKCAAD